MKTLITAALGLVLSASTGTTADLAGYDKFTFEAPHRAEKISASIWYPAGRKTYQGLVGDNAIFKGSRAYIGAAIAEGNYPLLILSHGSGGNMDTISWLSSGLAQKGMMILAVNHPGSTSGDSSPRRSIKVWERARDLTALLDAFLANDPLAKNVDRDRIYSMGFSLGGLTALHLAGLRTDKQAYVNYCDRFGEAAQDCLFFKKGGVDFEALPQADFNSVLRDDRVSAAIAIEPGMSYAFQKETVEGNQLPIQLINFGDNDSRWKAIDMGPNGSNLGEKLANATYVEIEQGSHFSFLAECKPDAEKLLKAESEDPICSDPAGTDRAKLHKVVIETIAEFIK
ncbi:alpha/beta fold hydrolase [Pararhizobium sp. IMCC21322]|uniref:alpha/beta hydrolase family protein n=1 Tax=Pararhizobium sp. IMCC21322 TaxID=3067903 RepID=UPI00274197E0|nr:alpha/beta fold hydrolase [Pararhizobium sp. IMCC21322]